MNFFKKNKTPLLVFLGCAVVLGGICAVLMMNNQKEWASIAVSFGSFFGMAGVFIIQMNKSEEQSKVLSSAKTIIEEAKEEIKKNQEGIDKVMAGQSTKVINDFPDNIPQITKKLQELSDKAEQDRIARKIIISTDIAGYGVLTNNQAFEDYLDVLSHTIAQENKHIEIQWYFYEDKLQKEQSRNQFTAYIQSPNDTEDVKKKKSDNFQVYLNGNNKNKKGIKSKIKLSCRHCSGGNCHKPANERACHIINEIKEPSSLPDALNKLEFIVREKLRTVPNIEKFYLTERLPFFSWIILECRDVEKATEAFISYPTYKEGADEKCLYTSDSELAKMYYSIVKDFVDENSVSTQKNFFENTLTNYGENIIDNSQMIY